MDYRVVFDVLDTWPDLSFPAFGSVFILFGALMVYGVRKAGPAESAFPMSVFPYFFFGFALLWTFLASTITVGGWWRDYDAMRSGRADLVEGVVENFVPMPPGSRGVESFTVGVREFRYRDFGTSSQFAYPSTMGGPVRAGQHVRIHALGPSIVKLEIATSDLHGPVRSVRTRGAIPWPFGIVPVLVLPWMALVSFAVSFLSGWRALAQRFAGDPIPARRRFLFQSAKLGFFGSYGNVLTVTIGDEAFSMVPFMPFSIGHALLVFPYASIRALTRKREFFVDWLEVELADESKRIRLRGKSADALVESFERKGGEPGRRIGAL